MHQLLLVVTRHPDSTAYTFLTTANPLLGMDVLKNTVSREKVATQLLDLVNLLIDTWLQFSDGTNKVSVKDKEGDRHHTNTDNWRRHTIGISND